MKSKRAPSRLSFLLTWLLCMVLFTPTLRTRAADPSCSLWPAVQARGLVEMKRLIAGGVNLETRNDEGWTPLIAAANAGDFEMAKLLVEKGANVNARSTSSVGSTALCFATRSDTPGMLELLLEHGARVNARSRNGTTALFVAVTQKNARAARFLLVKGADVNELAQMNESGFLFTPLMAAMSQQNLTMAELLLHNGANLEKRNNHGMTALMMASAYYRREEIKWLIEHGANVNARAPRGFTALLFAAENGQNENVKVLLGLGADAKAMDDYGHDSGAFLQMVDNIQAVMEARDHSSTNSASR